MIGSGHILDMIIRMKTNRSLLEKSGFNKMLFPKKLKNIHRLKHKKISAEKLDTIHHQMETRNKKDQLKTYWAILITLAIVTVLIAVLV
ncbi:MAG: hypothetical protein A2W95_11660 [Bacteroidetes bacterium GWA2_40_14]|nr:MAG: hypothetical protein A2W95_11660 [Bacteroidetes bacterium GWA2_40_14]HAZ03436.1 hypothetical protein [Marinilabiliales bacterium]